MKAKEQTCKRCVMDTSDAEIVFDDEGICNYCREAETHLKLYSFTEDEEEHNLQQIKSTIQASAKSKYDTILGLSGGVDSSYTAYLARKMGLNPLCVHFDNGWNSEIAVSNIKKIVDKCGFDLETYVISWPEFRDLQRSFFKAGVVDIEMLSDHAIMATMFKLRKQYGIKYVLSGTNYTTEHGMPASWIWRKQDLENIKDIQKKYGEKKIKEFPTMSSLKFMLARKFGWGGVYVELLNKVNYSKQRAMETLKQEFGWQYYGGKHYESTFTKFYQAYILPVKFGIDKRKVHLSAQIRTGEITREQALKELEQPLYTPSQLKVDKEFVQKKLGFSEEEFNQLMRETPRRHSDFKNDQWVLDLIKKISFMYPVKKPSK